MDAGHLQAQKIIVIHAGSMNLRVGLSSDLNPVTILHAIGRRQSTHGQEPYRDILLPATTTESSALQEFEEQRLQVSYAIQAYVPKHEERGSKRMRRIATPPQQIATFNRRSVPEELPFDEHHEQDVEIKVENKRLLDTIFDKDISRLTVNEAMNYSIHFPIRRGELNIHNGIGGSLESVLSDLQAIWLYALQQHMGIASNILHHYSAVLIITDIFNRSHLRELVSLLLQRMRFRSCFLIQDHVAATFGAGLGYACVVDIGDQKCSISCVEDAISQPDTRVRLGYGGGDVTQVFLTLLRKCCFPYKECDVLTSYSDAALMQRLKEHFCHISLDIHGAQEKMFEIKKCGKRLRYTLQLGDECIVAPLALFHTELLNITGKPKQVRIQLRSSQQPDSEDCFDAEYIRETGRRNGGRDQLLECGTMPVTGETADDDLVVVDNYDVGERDTNIKTSDKEELLYMNLNGQILPLEQAIMRSIERCTSDEMKRKMYGCILLVGGGIKFTGFAKYLEQKLQLQLETSYQRASAELTPFEVNVFTKEMDATMIAWKGAAIMSCLESAPELWIYGAEWNKCGLRILREKAPFIW